MCFIWFFRSLAILPWCTQQWRIGLCSLNGWSNWVVTSMPRTKNITPHYIWLRCIPGKVFRYLLRFDLSWPQFFHYGLFWDFGIWSGFTWSSLWVCWGFAGGLMGFAESSLGIFWEFPLGVHWGVCCGLAGLWHPCQEQRTLHHITSGFNVFQAMFSDVFWCFLIFS